VHLIKARLQAAAKAEHGFTLVAVLGIMLVVIGFSVAALSSAQGDQKPGLADKDRKQAYAAAEAGIADYLARLAANTDYWRKCTDDTTNLALNQRWDGVSARRWAPVPNSAASYTIELLPANTATGCDKNNPEATFIDTATGTFRIRSTGRPSTGSRIRRSIIATFRRTGFLDYIYYTDYETQDPALYKREAGGRPTLHNGANPRDIETWATEQCVKYWREDRASERFQGTATSLRGRLDGSNASDPSHWRNMDERCGEIQFYAQGTDETRKDKVLGPMHTNDEILVCGTPRFGRRTSDNIEVSGTGVDGTGSGWRSACSGSSPNVNQPGGTDPNLGTWRRNAPLVVLPDSNASLKSDALPAYRFVGKTTIKLTGDTMLVTNAKKGFVDRQMPVPSEGVVHIADDTTAGTCMGYDPINPYPASTPCGDVWVEGTYAKSLTITAENDIVIREDIRRSGDVLLGLISDDWVRVYHPTSGCSATGSSGTNLASGPFDITIDAAILSVKHSFTVDYFWCAPYVGSLNVNGAIGQKFRGPVGTSAPTGYIKNYNYDDRLRFRTPPKFLDPVQAAWKIKSQVEQVPAT
jgi:hypothetical protein